MAEALRKNVGACVTLRMSPNTSTKSEDPAKTARNLGRGHPRVCAGPPAAPTQRESRRAARAPPHARPPEFSRRPRRLPAGKLQLLIGVPADEESPRGSTKIRGGPRPRLSSVFAGSLNSAWAVADARNLTHADGPRRTSAIGAKVEVGFARGDRRAPPGKDR